MRSQLPTLLAIALAAAPALGQFSPADAVDINMDPDIVEVNLTAAATVWQFVPGQNTNVYAYNGQVPGPTIRAKVGDRLIVHFQNNLPEETTIHWHGVEIPADMDGSHISQAVVPPGGSFDYEFDLLREGLYWYHPHVRTFDQLERGLHGTLLVHDEGLETSLGLDQIEEHIVVFDDILLDASYQVVPAFGLTNPLQNALYQVNGREGNYLLVNGKVADTVTLEVPNGKPQRWRCINVANTTFCRLNIHDPTTGLPASTKLWELGNDAGFLEQPYQRANTTSTFPAPGDHVGQALTDEMWQGIFLLPGERLDVVFTPIGNDGDTFTLQNVDWFRGRHTVFYGPGNAIFMGNDPLDGNYPDKPFFNLKLTGTDPGTGEYVPPAQLKTYPPLPATTLAAPNNKLKLLLGHGLPDTAGNVPFFSQGNELFGGVIQPLPAPMITSEQALDVNVGEVWDWEVHNLTHGDHPFHTHGFFFELLEFQFIDVTAPFDPTQNFTWQPPRRIVKDTLRLPPRLGSKGTSRCIARLRVHFDDTGRDVRNGVVAQGETATHAQDGTWTAGGWLVHCHILEHAKQGMLTFFEVHDPASPFTLLGRHTDGTHGKVSLTGRGGRRGTMLHLDAVNGLENAAAGLVLGQARANLPLFGGTLIPSPLIVVPGLLDGSGEGTWSLRIPRNTVRGQDIYWQAAVLDGGAIRGWSLTNGLQFTTW